MAAKTHQTGRSASGARRNTSRRSAARAKAHRKSKAPDAKLAAGVAAISASIGAAAGAVARPLVDRKLHPSRKARITGLPGKAKGIANRLR
jgi:hypothetical protein